MTTGGSGHGDVDPPPVDAPARVVAGRANWLAANDPRLELNPPQYTAVLALASYDKVDGAAIDAAAYRAGVTPGRARRWLKTPYFRRAVAKEREEPAMFGFRSSACEDGPRAVSEARRAQSVLGSTERRALNEGRSER